MNMEFTEAQAALLRELWHERDENLRQELLAMAASLDNKKASRQDLGQMLVELGVRLRQESDNS